MTRKLHIAALYGFLLAGKFTSLYQGERFQRAVSYDCVYNEINFQYSHQKENVDGLTVIVQCNTRGSQKKGESAPFVRPRPFSEVGVRRNSNRGDKVSITKVWNQTKGPKRAKDILRNQNRQRSKACISLCKNTPRLLTGFLTGHDILRGHLGKPFLRDETTCTYCKEGEETAHHLVILGHSC